jgi:uncharacterized membrane protein
MKIGRLDRLPPKLRNLLSLINRRKVQMWKALRAQPFLVLLFIAILIYGIAFSYFTVLKHNVFQSSAWDLGIFNQALYTTLHNGRLFYYTAELYLNPSGSYFALHFSPILFLLLPIYAINSSPITLLMIQSFALPLGALPLYLLAKELLKSDKAGFVLASAYLLYPALQAANWFDFHSSALLPLLFFSLCYFMITRRWKLYFPCLLLVLMVEEHAVFAALVIAAYYFLISGNVKSFFKLNRSLTMDGQLASIVTLLICIVYYAFLVYIKSYFPINPKYLVQYKALQAFSVAGVQVDPILFPLYLLSNPQNALNALMYDYPAKFFYVILLFGPLLFIPFKSKLSIGVFALLAFFLFSNYRPYYVIGNQYPLYTLPLIFIAAVYGLRKFEFHARSSILRTILLVTLLFIVSTSPLSPISNTFAKEGLLWYPIFNFAPNENTVSLNDLVNVIPPNASVLTQITIFPHVSSRINAYVLPTPDVANNTGYIAALVMSSEYVLLDLTWNDLNTNFVLDLITHNNAYGAYALASNAVLFKRGFQGEPMFVHFTEYRVFSAYKDLSVAPFVQTISDQSATGKKVVMCPKNLTGYFVFGPYNYLLQGSYEVTFTVKVGENNNSRVGWCDILSSSSTSAVSRKDIFGFELQPNTWTNFTLPFASTKLMTQIEFRAFNYGTADMYVDRVIVKRISPNATSDFGLRTFGSGDLLLYGGYASKEGFSIFPQNTTSSTFWFGPYLTLPAGKYKATCLLKVSPLPPKIGEHILTLSLSANSGTDVLAKYEVKTSDFLSKENAVGWQEFSLEFIVKDTLRNVEFAGLNPSPNFAIYLAYIAIEPNLSPGINYVTYGVQKGLQVRLGTIISDVSSHNGYVALSRKGVDKDILTYGPYAALPSGAFEAVFRIKTHETAQNAIIGIEVTTQQGTVVLSQKKLDSSEIYDDSWFNVTLPFSLESSTTGIEFRASSNGMTNLYVDTVTLLYP